MKNTIVEFILYVADQRKSRDFYTQLLEIQPILDVPGMTEFQLSSTCKLGLMPEAGISKILSINTPHPATGNGIPRCEIYIYVDNLDRYYEKAINLNASLISPLEEREWGDIVCYFSDPDGHILAFAQRMIDKK